MRLVVKYGGSTLSSALQIQKIAEYIVGLSGRHQIILVCSAAGDTTDALMEISELIRTGNRQGTARLIHDITEYHNEIALKLAGEQSARDQLLANLNTPLTELRALVDGLLLLGEETPHSLDYLLSFGERLSILLVSAALEARGARAMPLSGKDAGIMTDSQFGKAQPLMDTTRLRVSKTIGGMLDEDIIPVLGGYTGADQHNKITTFGRGGSDYTATIIGSCMDADQIWLMGNMDGMMTADPSLVENARVLDEISYAEAIEMTMFGAKQIHPRTFDPVMDNEIPLRIRSATNTVHRGTLVAPSHSNTTKCVSALRGNGLIDIRGFGMVGSPGTAARIFDTLAGPEISVMMISQNPSESSITIVLKNKDLHRAVHALEIEHLGRIIKQLDVTANVAIVALIGMGLRGTVGAASRAFTAVSDKNVNVIMITQGSSEMNLAFVVRDSDVRVVVQALHDEFGMAAAT